MKDKIKCINCKKNLIRNQKKFCSVNCETKYNKKHKIGNFYNSKLQSELGKKGGKIGGKKAMITNKKNKTGLYGLTYNDRIRNNKKINANHKKNKTGRFNSELQRQNALKNKIKKTGAFHNPELNRQIRINISKNRGTYKFKNIFYDSRREIEVAYDLYYQNKIKLIERKTVHFLISLKEVDFKINKYKCFIEVHPLQRWTNQNLNYYKIRRKILNAGGYKDYNLLVIE